MLRKIIETSLARRFWIVGGIFVLLCWAAAIVQNLPIDAVPDITNVQVVVNAKTGGLDPQQVEKSVTYFVEAEVSGLPRVKEVRSLSRFGLSQTVVIFEDGTDIYWARQQVAEKANSLGGTLPAGVTVELAPITTGLGEVLMYAIQPKPDSKLSKKTEKEQLLYLRTVQDFVLRPFLKSNVRGIAEVDSGGGYKKQIHIDFKPALMESHGVTFNQLLQKLRTIGENYGGGYVEEKGQQIIVRTDGQMNLQRLRDTPVRLTYVGGSVTLKQVANVEEDHAQRIGAATDGGKEIVMGTVMMLLGQNSRKVATNAEEALKIAPLPEDVQVEVLYSRSYLVGATVRTVTKNLAEGALIVTVIILLVLGNFRAALIVAISIPLSMAFALIGMKAFNISANLMSLGAIDFGLIVDGSIVIIENLISKFEHKWPETFEEKFKAVLISVMEVLPSLITGLIIIMAVYIPILTLEGTEGKLYYPMAMTVLFALTGAMVIAVVVMPSLALLFIRKPKSQTSGIFSVVSRAYKPVLEFPLKNIRKLMIPVALWFVLCGVLFSRLGSDFMPPLNEGDMVINLVHDAKISLTESLERQKRVERIISAYGEVERVFGRIGTSEAATDPMGVNLGDIFVILKKDTNHWRKGARGNMISKDELFALIETEIKPILEKTTTLDETEIVQSQPIAMRFNEILEGSRADVSLRIFGKDLDTLVDLQDKAVEILKKIPGAREVELDALTALRKGAMLNAKLRYDKLNYYGISVSDVNESLQTAMVGQIVGNYYEYDWRFPILVKLSESHRERTSQIANIPISLTEGGTVQLGDLAHFSMNENVVSIARSAMNRYAGIAVFLGNRDTSSFVNEAKDKIKTELKIPGDYRLHWGGQFQNLERARLRLAIIVPLILIGIFILVYTTFHSLKQTLLIFLTIPFAWTGGVISLYFAGIHFSVSAAVGFIALSGVAVLNGLVKITYLNQLRAEGHSVAQAVRMGAINRLRPVMMTALVASLGFLPMVINTGIGAEVQRPLAVVVLGGLVTATLMTLLLMPAIYLWLEDDDKSVDSAILKPRKMKK